MNDRVVKAEPVSPAMLYDISTQFWKSDSWRTAMNGLVKSFRKYFLFDNMVINLIDPMTMNLDVAFAKATGRGKSAEADVAWGEILGNQVVEEKRTILVEPDAEDQKNRLQNPFILGIPIMTPHEVLGAITFIRFGGPVFTANDTGIAEYITRLLSLQIYKERIKQERDNLEFQFRTFQMQEDFISTVSHELRNPLGFIKGYTTTLLRNDTNWDAEIQREFLTIIDQETDRLQDLIANLLDSAKLQSGQIVMNFEAVRLDALMNDLLLRARLHHPDAQINANVTTPIKTIQGDPRRIAQVLDNLISNAVKYAPGSPIYITIKETSAGVAIEVHDEGPGIPEKYLKHVFNRFFRVPDQSPSVHGSGLGLFICKQIIQAHNGGIEIESSAGQGTTFKIFLPDQP